MSQNVLNSSPLSTIRNFYAIVATKVDARRAPARAKLSAQKGVPWNQRELNFSFSN